MGKKPLFVKVSGSNYEMGYQHGQQCSALIKKYLKILYETVRKSTSLTPAEILPRTKRFVPYMEDYAPHLVEEMKGIAEGSGVSFDEITFLHCRGEMTYPQPEKCTSFAVSGERTANGQVLIGQNMDWLPVFEDISIVLHLTPKTGPTILCFTFAGVVAQCGINSKGLARVGNGLISHRREAGVPRQFIFRSILEQTNIDDAVEMVRKATRAKGGNMVYAETSGRILDTESTAFTDRVLEPENGFIAHANHYLHPELVKYDMGVARGGENFVLNTQKRYERMKQLISEEGQKITVDIAKKWLRDHENRPRSICRHLDPNLPPNDFSNHTTFASIIGEPSKGIAHICVSNPCENLHLVYKI